MKGFIYGKTKCDICGRQMRPRRNFYRITIGCYDNDHPNGGVEGLYDLCPRCCHEVCDFLDDLMSRKNEGEMKMSVALLNMEADKKNNDEYKCKNCSKAYTDDCPKEKCWKNNYSEFIEENKNEKN